MPTVFREGEFRFYFFSREETRKHIHVSSANGEAKIQNISPRGFWIFDGEKEYFVSFKDYPDFYTATVQQINDFTVDAFGNFHWEVLDIDIEKESLETPENYPLVFKKELP